MSEQKIVPSYVISDALRELAKTIQSGDGVANLCCLEAATRIDELQSMIDLINMSLKNANTDPF